MTRPDYLKLVPRDPEGGVEGPGSPRRCLRCAVALVLGDLCAGCEEALRERMALLRATFLKGG